MHCKYFLPGCGLPFYFLIVSFDEVFFLFLLSIFYSFGFFWYPLKKSLLIPIIKTFFYFFFPSKSFIILDFMLQSMNHLKLIFVCGIMWKSRFNSPPKY